jgi:hypothetical protein
MIANTLFNNRPGCPLTLHKTQLNSLGTLAEAVSA